MATPPRVGVFRKSMMINPRIIEAPLGKPRLRGFSIPGPDFTYGVAGEIHEGVSQVLSGWRQQEPPGLATRDSCPLDFVALNRNAVKSGVTTAKELHRYRALRPPSASQPIRRKQQKSQPKSQPQSQPSTDNTYGVKSRADPPMELLLAHEYGHDWITEQRQKIQTESQRRSATWRPIVDTRTTLLRKTQILPQNQTQPLPRMSRYSKVGAALDTFRDPDSRSRALKALKRDAGQ